MQNLLSRDAADVSKININQSNMIGKDGAQLKCLLQVTTVPFNQYGRLKSEMFSLKHCKNKCKIHQIVTFE